MQTYTNRLWQITEQPFKPHDAPHLETIFTVGNGLVGTRATLEEGYPGDNPATLAAGIFNQPDGVNVPELVSMPNWLSLNVTINGELFQMNRGTILGYERTLDCRTGTLRRAVLWLSPKQDILRLLFDRFASLDNPHVLVLRLRIQVLSEGQHLLTVTSKLDGTVMNPGGIDHWGDLKQDSRGDRLTFAGKTNPSGYEVAMNSQLLVDGPAVTWTEQSSDRAPGHMATFSLDTNQWATFTKITTLHTTRDSQDPIEACRSTMHKAAQQGYDSLKVAHDAAWKQRWQAMDIVIEGDDLMQQAIRFSIYHLLIAVPTHEDRVGIAAKTLSGFGYKGHVFWDTEIFLIPPLTLTLPEQARNLLMYRYHNLDGAREKAAGQGYEGALFPWESTDTGKETTPQWTDPHPITGERVRIWMGDNEHHLSSDIAYAVLQYWRWTRDDAWFVRYGAELVLDVATFWGSRAEYNDTAGRYEIRTQIGPDEYHENIDNSVFVNRMAQWSLEQALSVFDWLRDNHPNDANRLTALLDLTEERLAHWRDVVARMWIPVRKGVFEQFEGFFDLEPLNLADYQPRTTNIELIIGFERTERTRVIKQADVVMLMALLGSELGDGDFLRRNWETYLPIVDHGSSLSPSIYAWVGARLGELDEAYRLLVYAAMIDLADNKGNVRDGIHAAACGGLWQAIVFGFCGLHLTADGPKINPNLPDHWRRVRFGVQHAGKHFEFDLKQE